MGVSTKGCVVTPNKDVMLVAMLIDGALRALISKRIKEQFPDIPRFAPEVREKFAAPEMVLKPETGLIAIHFKHDGESRMMHLFMTADVDNKGLGPQSLSLSLGCSGNSVLFMRAALQPLGLLGDAFILECDSNDTPYVPLEDQTKTVLQALARKQMSGYSAEGVVEKYVQGQLALNKGTGDTFESFVGCTATQWLKLTSEPEHSVRWNAMRDFAKNLYPQQEVIAA